MHSHLNDLPITGKSSTGEPQATVDELSSLIMPVINHPEIAEIGFSVTYLSMDSDPEMYEVRRIWVRTIHDESRQTCELSLPKHPTLGDILFGRATTDLGRNIDALWHALRDSRYRDAVLAVFGFGCYAITVSSEGITVGDDDFDDVGEDDWH